MLSKKQINVIKREVEKESKVTYPMLRLTSEDVKQLESCGFNVKFVYCSFEGIFSDAVYITCPEISRKENA